MPMPEGVERREPDLGDPVRPAARRSGGVAMPVLSPVSRMCLYGAVRKAYREDVPSAWPARGSAAHPAVPRDHVRSGGDGDHSGRVRAAFEVVVLAASAGGLGVLMRVLAALPPDFPAAVLVVQHRGPLSGTALEPAAGHHDDPLATLLGRRSALPVRVAAAGERLTAGTVLVVPLRTALRLDAADTVVLEPAGSRRMADTTLAALAGRFGPRLIGVVLTGLLDDGAAGVRAVKAAGGRVLVQDPHDAAAAAMPTAALATGCVDLVLPAARMATALTAFIMAPGAAELLQVPIPAWARPTGEGHEG
ncbi:chemotaxis protein CheB [Spirillospora sp. NPDC048911]|uniref:chemotaxis protein CheB n=1 Tax=Spirillospora sp. NPDC048911 TaxID=3364527 RepID=UPI0037172041